MPKIYALFVYEYNIKNIIAEAYDLSHAISNLQIWKGRQLSTALRNLALDLLSNFKDHQREHSILHSQRIEEYAGHIFHTSKDMAIICATDRNYPIEAIHLVFKECLEVMDRWGFYFDLKDKSDVKRRNKQLDHIVVTWNKVDFPNKLQEIQDDLVELKKIMEANIQKVIERHETIEELLISCEQISKTSEQFLKKSKRLNSCCIAL